MKIKFGNNHTENISLLLINPINRLNPPAYLPYGLLYIASYVREAGYSVKIYDRNADKRNIKYILNKYNPKCVGISVLTGPAIKDAIHISKIIKNEKNSIKIIWGGLHPTLFPEQVLRTEYVDFVVIGEGEITCLELLKCIAASSSKCDTIKGIAYKSGNEIMINRPREFIENLDELPPQAWDLVDLRKYFRNMFYSNRGITFNTSRGCPFRCNFCYNQSVNKRVWRGLSAERIIADIKFLQSKDNPFG